MPVLKLETAKLGEMKVNDDLQNKINYFYKPYNNTVIFGRFMSFTNAGRQVGFLCDSNGELKTQLTANSAPSEQEIQREPKVVKSNLNKQKKNEANK